MTKKLSIFLLIIVIIVISDVLSAGSASVTFLVKIANIDSTSRIFITGNQRQLSKWNPGRTALKNSLQISGAFRSISQKEPKSNINLHEAAGQMNLWINGANLFKIQIID